MTIKLILGLSIVLMCTFLGTSVAGKCKKKKDFYTDMESFCIFLKREISFSSTTIGKAISDYRSKNEDLRNILSSYLQNANLSQNFRMPENFSQDEKEMMVNFFSKIGKSDRKNELELLTFFSEEVSKYKEIEKKKSLKISGLSTKLGFFIGAIIFVILL